jgi:hypothetical protein
MSKFSLPSTRVLNSAFKERGRSDVVKIDVLPVKDGEILRLVFEGKNSPWRQGVWMKTDESVVVNKLRCPSVQLWADTAPQVIMVECRTKDGLLHVYNIWDNGQGSRSLSWSSGMLVEELPNGRRYHCNDVGFETDFTKLIFRIERVDRN